MIAKRIAAVAAAAVLVLAAIVIRDRIIDGEPDSGRPTPDATVLVCPTELREVCAAAAGDSITVETEEAGVTLDRFADTSDAPIWVTFEPFPEMLDTLRSAAGVSPLQLEVERLVSSPLVLATNSDVAAGLTSTCGDPVELRCVGDSGRSVGFARSPESGTGLLGLARFAQGYLPGGAPFGDALFERWLRGLATDITGDRMSAGTAISTFQVRQGLMDVAVGPDAELTEAGRERFVVLYAEPMGRIDIVVAVPDGTSAPDGLSGALRTELVRAGWVPPEAVEGAVPDGGAVLAVRDIWRDS